jgi:hypothetical protein
MLQQQHHVAGLVAPPLLQGLEFYATPCAKDLIAELSGAPKLSFVAAAD